MTVTRTTTRPTPTRLVPTRPVLVLATAAVAALLLVAGAGPAAAQDPMGPPDTTLPPAGDRPPAGADCGPGNIIRYPNCGQEPASRDDPGGWLQVSLFFVVCAAVLVIVGLLVRRSRRLRSERTAAGLDPVALARSRGEGVRAPRP